MGRILPFPITLANGFYSSWYYCTNCDTFLEELLLETVRNYLY